MTESKYSIRPLEFDGVSTYALAERRSKVHAGLFGRPARAGETVAGLVDKLPKILAAADLQDLIAALREARRDRKALVWGMGGHVIKCGLGPILIDLMRDGFVTGIAMNGAALIHDFEIALEGSTSEDVERELGAGRFGMARETGERLNAAVNQGARDGLGIGESAGRSMDADRAAFRHLESSVVFEAYARRIPVTVHLAIGTDITHVHPSASGENLGAGTMRDFKLLCAIVRGLEGGVYINLGSAVILPEVFLKAVSVVRNLGGALRHFTTANLDFIQHYRPRENVLRRPTQDGGRAIALTGHHEILLPLVAAALKGPEPPE